MDGTTRNFFILTAAAAVGVTISIMLLITVRQTPPPAEVVRRHVADRASIDAAGEISKRLVANGLRVDHLNVSVVAGTAIVSGEVDSSEQMAAVADAVRGLGYARVANLVQAKPSAQEATDRR